MTNAAHPADLSPRAAWILILALAAAFVNLPIREAAVARMSALAGAKG